MKAKHPGPCTACGGRIHPGDEIEPADTESVIDGHHQFIRAIVTGWQHATCGSLDRGQTSLLEAVALDADPVAAYGPLCRSCFSHHRGECA